MLDYSHPTQVEMSMYFTWHKIQSLSYANHLPMIPRYFMFPSFSIAPADADTSSTKAYAELTEFE